MGQGVAWAARELGLPCTVVVPDHAPETKLAAIERLGGKVVKVAYERWWQAISESAFPRGGGRVHPPGSGRARDGGQRTIGLEILDDLPDPTGCSSLRGGGPQHGIASAVKAVLPTARVYAVEPETGAPLTAAFESERPEPFEYRVSFVDGSGSPACCRRCGRARRPRWTGRCRLARRDRRGGATTRRAARGGRRRRRRSALAAALQHAGTRTWCASSPAGHRRRKLARILAGETP
jgi:threonine dehydratase